MKSKKIAMAALTSLLAMTWGTTALAQVHHEVEMSRSQIQADRQAIVAANLPMTEPQSAAFWPLYREYRAEMAKVGDRTVGLIESYAKNMDTMTDPQAKQMLDEFFAIRKQETKIMSSWAGKFGKVLPPKGVARFYQIENKLDAIIRYEVAATVPLIEHKPGESQPEAK